MTDTSQHMHDDMKFNKSFHLFFFEKQVPTLAFPFKEIAISKTQKRQTPKAIITVPSSLEVFSPPEPEEIGPFLQSVRENSAEPAVVSHHQKLWRK